MCENLQSSEWLRLGRVHKRRLDLLRFLGQEDGLDVGQNSALSDGDAGQEPVQLLVVPDGQLQVTRDDSRLLVVLGGVSGELEDLGGQIPKN